MIWIISPDGLVVQLANVPPWNRLPGYILMWPLVCSYSSMSTAWQCIATKKGQIKISIRVLWQITLILLIILRCSGDTWEMFKGIIMNNCQTLKVSGSISICYWYGYKKIFWFFYFYLLKDLEFCAENVVYMLWYRGLSVLFSAEHSFPFRSQTQWWCLAKKLSAASLALQI